MARRSDTFKAVALAAVRSGMSVQEVADSMKLARSALYAWVAHERKAGDRPVEELVERDLAGVADDVATLVETTDLLQMQVGRVGQLVAFMAALAVAPTVSDAGVQP
ncbi:helix-turn-helix domain-containing protein [Pseudomonas mosselii]|uniref:helix-turn-helix domain-containing protein n=1 Tax=Pseudomonas mosselii TaxID=78327 RepID=UPI001A9D0795|nr:helix-turn-helix domain-containing protein [Pseudomonas mosselii]MCH7418445.1 helix-turn-helix domain containing protein [Pseudomonas mosselii]